jgi:hypothetical protein
MRSDKDTAQQRIPETLPSDVVHFYQKIKILWHYKPHCIPLGFELLAQ